ncbi:hypothetical protein C7377_0697 [Balneicella halophila]|uniref:Uncharacterized protein n=1 Tax=Balneicella halophila TaxID=1537566 RepID=A0A7L4URK7_BALHA|nr:hypothetical protein C7377_0697 [Balneicella halophila]
MMKGSCYDFLTVPFLFLICYAIYLLNVFLKLYIFKPQKNQINK